MKRLMFFFLSICLTVTLFSQPNNNYYYYKGLQSAITLSEKVMFVKFLPGLTNAQKQNLITQAQVDLMNGDWNSINDLVQLKSRILQRQVLYYPCGNPPIEARTQNKTTKKDSSKINARVAPCDGCPPPNCDPYWITESYDNFMMLCSFSLTIQTFVPQARL